MFSPSTAPRWKIVTSTFLRGVSAAAAVRARKAGAKPRLTSARPPFLRKMRREYIWNLPFLELRRSEHERDGLWGLVRFGDRGNRFRRHVAAEHTCNQRIASRL